jgi:hypothetical protein
LCAFLFCTQGCGRVGRPAFPAPSDFEAKDFAHNSDASRRENAESYSAVIARSEATKQSSFFNFRKEAGLLRGACHRARIRATRWLAMTVLGCLKI